MSHLYEVINGPFAGKELDTSKLIPWRYANGQPVIYGGKEMVEWGLDYLTPIFLDVFDPNIGWSVVTEMDLMEGVSLPDYQNPMIVEGKTVTNAFGGDVPSQLQVLKISASLSNPEGRVIQRSVLLQGIHNLNSAELGIKKALLQLYRAMGLPTSPAGSAIQIEEEPVKRSGSESIPTIPPKGSINQIKAISAVKSTSEGEDVTEDDNVLGPHGSESQAPASESAATAEGTSVPTDEGHEQVVGSSEGAIDNSHINPRVLTQIEHFAKLAGTEVRQLTDDADARAELVKIRVAANKRK